MRRKEENQKAVALIFSISVLAILSVTAVSWARMTNMEMRATENYTNRVKAQFVARSGIDYAIAELRAMIANGTIDAPNARWHYDSSNAALSETLSPSFYAGTKGDKGYSGVVSGTYTANGDVFTLKVTDTSGSIYINGGIFDGETSPTYGNILANMINNLALALKANGKGAHLTGAEGSQIITNRPSAGYSDLLEIKSLLGDTKYKEIKDYLTVRAWVDQTTFRAIKTDDTDADTFYDDIESVVVEPRAPININVASVEVLTAVFSDIRASYCEDEKHRLYSDPPYQVPNNNSQNGIRITGEQASLLASEIDKKRKKATPEYFHSWQEFYDFLHNPGEGLKAFHGVGSDDEKHLRANVIFANCNPNTDIKFNNPNASWGSLGRKQGQEHCFRGVDKFDLYEEYGTPPPKPCYTTELCFNLTGTFEIQSLGRIWTEDKKEVCREHIYTIIEVFNITTLSTQADFEGSGATIAPGFSQVPGRRDIKISSASLKTNVATYPEFDPRSTEVVIPQEDQRIKTASEATNFKKSAAIYDGQVMLATKTGLANSSARVHLNFEPDNDNTGDAFDADDVKPVIGFWGSSSEVIERSLIAKETDNIQYSTYRYKTGDIVTIPHFENNTNLTPDGVYFTSRRHIHTSPTDAWILGRATTVMWVKPAYSSHDDEASYLIKGSNNPAAGFGVDILYGAAFDSYGYSNSMPTLFSDSYVGVSVFGIPILENVLSTWHNYAHPEKNKIQFVLLVSIPVPPAFPLLYIQYWLSATGNKNPKMRRGEWMLLSTVLESSQVKLYINDEQHNGDSGINLCYGLMLDNDWGIYSASRKPAMAMGTEDEMQVYGDDLSSSDIGAYYAEGRYHDTGTYVSPEISLTSNESVVWQSIKWTGFIPQDISANTSITVDVDVGSSGSFGAYAPDTGTFTDPTASNVIGLSGTAMKFRATLNSTEIPLLDTPVLDDVTIIYYKASPTVIEWKENYEE